MITAADTLPSDLKTQNRPLRTNADRLNISPSKGGALCSIASFAMDEIRTSAGMNSTATRPFVPVASRSGCAAARMQSDEHKEIRQKRDLHKRRVDARDHRPESRICVLDEHGCVISREEHEFGLLAAAHHRRSPIRRPHDRVTEFEPSIPSQDSRLPVRHDGREFPTVRVWQQSERHERRPLRAM
jgi:hypothetical protein